MEHGAAAGTRYLLESRYRFIYNKAIFYVKVEWMEIPKTSERKPGTGRTATDSIAILYLRLPVSEQGVA